MIRSAVGRGSRRFMTRRRKQTLALESLEPRLNMSLDVPALSSLPGANQTIYLDFNGHTTTGTSWNSAYGVDPIVSPAYDTDGDPLNFSAGELATIQKVWQRVSEDYAPFQVNVTTVPPAAADLVKSGTGDTKWGVTVVITKDTAFNCGCGGKAYIDSFNWDTDTPVWVFNTSEIGVAEAASHEVGHSLGLSHDGTSTSSYYQGHGSGVTSWAPIMGVGYYVNVSQWDQGEYYDSNNGTSSANYGKGPDDLNIIATYNGFGYKADDYGDTTLTAATLPNSSGTVAASGIISKRTDVDMFQFSTSGGAISLNITPAALGADLDIRADLLDSNGQVIATSNPDTSLAASFSLTLAAGQYYLKIDGTGVGNPTVSPPTGYTDYASIGQYSISGTVAPPSGDTLDVSSTVSSEPEGNSGTTYYTFTVNRSGDTSGTSTVNYTVTGTSGAPAAASDFAGGALPSGTLTFNPGVTSMTVNIGVAGDTTVENDEEFTLSLTNPGNGTSIGNGHKAETIQNDDTAPVSPTISVSATDAQKSEGTGANATPYVFTISRAGDTSQSASVKYSVAGSGAKAASSNDFSGPVPTNVLVQFAAGEKSKDITVYVVADSTKESDETFKVTLSSPTGATLGTASATGSILNDDNAKSGRIKLMTAAMPKLVAVADPMWMFVPPEQLTPAQLAVPVVTWVDGTAYIGDLDESLAALDSTPASELLAGRAVVDNSPLLVTADLHVRSALETNVSGPLTPAAPTSIPSLTTDANSLAVGPDQGAIGESLDRHDTDQYEQSSDEVFRELGELA